MDNKKFEQLIELIINEDEDQARELFHDIVVEKSREIYESMMSDEMDEGMGDQVGGLLDEINAEEAGGMNEEDEDDMDMDIDMDDEVEMSSDEEDEDDMGGEELEDRVVDLEDKLDQLMAEFEEIMGGEGEDMDMDMDMEVGDEDGDDEMDMEVGDEEVMEAVQLQKVSVTHGDNGVQTKSPSSQNSGQAGMDSKPVKFSGAAEADPRGPKGPSNLYAKSQGEVKDAGKFKNAPAQNNFSEKGESTPKPVTKDEAGKVRSPVAESRKPAKRRI